MMENRPQGDKGRYGARRIRGALGYPHIQVNYKRASRLMSGRGPNAKGRRQSCHYPPNGHAYHANGGMPNRVLTVNEKGRGRVGEGTGMPIKHGCLKRAVFIGIYSRKVTGRAMDIRFRDPLGLSALHLAIGREQP